jgi:microcystin-dependent protein
MSDPFIGEIRIFAGNFAPRDWAFCDGTLLPIAQNTALFALLGTTYGGDGRTTLGLPNLQGRTPIHAGRGPGLTDRRLGQQGGVQNVTLNAAQMPAHTHAASADNLSATISPASTADPRGNSLAAATVNVFNTDPPNVDMSIGSLVDDIGLTGGGQAHENMPPYLALHFIIALVGLFPPRP